MFTGTGERQHHAQSDNLAISRVVGLGARVWGWGFASIALAIATVDDMNPALPIIISIIPIV